MDFSLVQAESKHFALRDILALKRRWPYYAVMVVDPTIRFSWIFYAIFTHNRQHSTLVSFLVGLAEVLRRGVWALFRVENEHCANVSQYKASRDVPLPYRIEPLLERASASASEEPSSAEEPGQQQQQQQQQQARRDTGGYSVDEAEQGRLGTASSTAVAPSTAAMPIGSASGGGRMTIRHRADTTMTGRSFSKILAEAHTQDFEKRRRTPAEQAVEDRAHHGGGHVIDDDDDDDEEDEEEEEEEEALEANEVEEHRRMGTEGRL